MTRRDRVPNLRSTAGTFALGAVALLSAACESVPDLTLDPGDAWADAGDARADAGDASDGSPMDSSAQLDACPSCMGVACAAHCSECAVKCFGGQTCCTTGSGSLLCKPPGRQCP